MVGGLVERAKDTAGCKRPHLGEWRRVQLLQVPKTLESEGSPGGGVVGLQTRKLRYEAKVLATGALQLMPTSSIALREAFEDLEPVGL